MRFTFKQKYWVGIIVAVFILAIDFYLYFVLNSKRWFFSLIVVAITIGWLQFWIDFFAEIKRQREIELKFLEFIRNLVDNVRSGVTITKGIINVADEDYGALTPYIKKLARQLEWGIPLHKSLVTFANDTYNVVIKRSVSIIIEADESGGDIESILDQLV